MGEEGSAERCRRLVSLLISKSPSGGGREGFKRKTFFDVGEVLCTQGMTGAVLPFSEGPNLVI